MLDFHRVDARSKGRQLGPGAAERLGPYDSKYGAVPAAGLLQGLLHERRGNAADLDVHLKRCDAVLGPTDFEVHIAQMIFKPKDVGQNIITSDPSLINPIAMPATGSLIGTPASIMASVPPHTVAIEEEPFDSKISDTIRKVYGKTSLVGMTGFNDRSAKAPCPTSRLPGERSGRASPTLKGGKL